MIKVIFMGTPDFSVIALEALKKCKDIEVGLVITGMDKKRGRNKILPTPVKQKAKELGIETYEPENVNSIESIKKINEYNPDYIVVIAFGQIIKDELLEKYNNKIINIHSSLLPKYRGPAPMQWTILNKDKKAGVCSMLIEKTMDTGDILKCEEILIDENTNISKLHNKLSQISGDLIVDTILNYDNLFLNRVKQDDKNASYSKKIDKSMGHIHFNQDAVDIKAKIMAFSVWPSAYVIYNQDKIKIHKISIIEKYTNDEIGKILKVNEEGIFVNCNDKCIIIKEIQFPGKKSMSVKSFLLGNDIKQGEYLF